MSTYNIKILTKVNDDWNQFLAKNKHSTFFQTQEYFESDLKDHFPVFIYILNKENEIVGQLAMRIINTSIMYSSPILKRIMRLVSNITKRGIWVYGPIIHADDKNSRLEILEQIILAVDEISEKYNLTHVEGQTPPEDLIDYDYVKVFEENGYSKNEFVTFIADLDNPIEEIWNNISKKAKGDVGRAQRRNIVTKMLETYDDLKQYLLLNQEWARTKGLVITDPFKEVEILWKNHNRGLEKIFLAYDNNKLISGVRVGCFNGIGYTNFVINSYSDSTNLGGTLLTWHILEWAKKTGMKTYDFSGGPKTLSNTTLTHMEEKNPLLFYKSKWGGKETKYYDFIKARKKFSYKLYCMMFNAVRKYHNSKIRRNKTKINKTVSKTLTTEIKDT